jgi:hypothetical protein
MYGTEINLKITDFDDYEEMTEIIEWLTYMVKKARAKEIEKEIQRSAKRSKKVIPIPYSLETIKEEPEEEEEEKKDLDKPIEEKKPETQVLTIGHTTTVIGDRIKCSCGVEYIKKNKSRHEKSKGHLQSMSKN